MDLGGAPSVPTRDEASVESVFSVAVLKERRGMLTPRREAAERRDKTTNPFRFVLGGWCVGVEYALLDDAGNNNVRLVEGDMREKRCLRYFVGLLFNKAEAIVFACMDRKYLAIAVGANHICWSPAEVERDQPA